MYITFDIGGTNMRLGASADGQTIAETAILPTDPHDFEKAIEAFVGTAKQLSQGQSITAVAGGIAGPLDTDKTMITTAPNIPDWNGRPLKKILEERLNAPAYLENDTAMIGLGEALAGAAQGKRIVAYITVSTGVGGCRIIDGAIDTRALGFEPGHQIIDSRGPKCGCGGHGHLEALVSGAAFERMYGQSAKDVTDPEAWEHAAYHLALGLNNVLVFWSPDTIILGGALMQSIDIDLVRRHLRQIVTIFPHLPPVELCDLADKAGLIGSLHYLRQTLNR